MLLQSRWVMKGIISKCSFLAFKLVPLPPNLSPSLPSFKLELEGLELEWPQKKGERKTKETYTKEKTHTNTGKKVIYCEHKTVRGGRYVDGKGCAGSAVSPPGQH